MCEFPRSLDFEVAVDATHELHDGFDRLRKASLGKAFLDFGNHLTGEIDDFLFGFADLRCLRELAFEVIEHQAVHAVQYVAEVVGEVAVDATDKAFVSEVCILSYDHFTGEEVAERVDTVFFHVIHRVHDVACGLAHLFAAVHEPPTVGKNVFRKRNVKCHEHCRPIDAVGRQNVLADQVVSGRPNRSAVRISLVEGGRGAYIV